MPTVRLAALEDIPLVLPMMREFYALEGIPFDAGRATSLLEQLISEPRNGRLVLIDHKTVPVGYMIVGFGFSIEFGGRDALLDELFVKPEFRGLGFGKASIDYAERICVENGIQALHLESDHFNDRAHELYLRLGFKDHKRHLMTKWMR
jgi:diamine N-acetyltransferase